MTETVAKYYILRLVAANRQIKSETFNLDQHDVRN